MDRQQIGQAGDLEDLEDPRLADTSDRDGPVPGSDPTGVVDLSFAVDADLLVLARLAVAHVASRSGFDIEEIDDLRLAVDELCLSVLGGRRGGRLQLRLDGTPDRIEVWCHHEDPVGTGAGDGEPVPGDEDVDGLSDRILDALVDEHGRMTLDGRAGARLAKRRAVRDG